MAPPFEVLARDFRENIPPAAHYSADASEYNEQLSKIAGTLES